MKPIYLITMIPPFGGNHHYLTRTGQWSASGALDLFLSFKTLSDARRWAREHCDPSLSIVERIGKRTKVHCIVDGEQC